MINPHRYGCDCRMCELEGSVQPNQEAPNLLRQTMELTPDRGLIDAEIQIRKEFEEQKDFVSGKHYEPEDTWTGGRKDDGGKAPLDLLSSLWLFGVAQVLGFGAKKYAAHNWRKGIKQSRLIAAALRHLLAFNDGESFDPESQLCHLLHASCCLMFAYEMFLTRPDLDDRYRVPVPEAVRT
jgi:hypothetical protein